MNYGKMQKSVVIVKNDKGEVLEVNEMQTLNEERVNELKKQAQENSAKYSILEAKREEDLKNELMAMREETKVLRKALAKVIFENEVEKGTCTEDDEEKFKEIYGGLCK